MILYDYDYKMVDLWLMGNTNNNPWLANSFSKILKNNPLTSWQTKSTNSLLSQAKNITPVADIWKVEAPLMDTPQGAMPWYIGNLKNAEMFTKPLPEIKKPAMQSTIPQATQPIQQPKLTDMMDKNMASASGISGVNKPTVWSQFWMLKWAEQTMVTNMPQETQKEIVNPTFVPKKDGEWKIDPIDFAKVIKQKYPDYINVDDATLAHKILEKYPDYSTQVRDYVGNKWLNAVPLTTVVRAGSATKSFVSNIVDMAKNWTKSIVSDWGITWLPMLNAEWKIGWKELLFALVPWSKQAVEMFWWKQENLFDNTVNKLAQKAQDEIQKKMWWDLKSNEAKVTSLLTQTLPFFFVPQMSAEAWVSEVTSKISSKLSYEFPKLAKFLSNGVVRKILTNTIESIPNTEITTQISQWKMATPWQLALWAVAQNAIWAKDIYKAVKPLTTTEVRASSKALDLIKEKNTAKTRTLADQENRLVQPKQWKISKILQWKKQAEIIPTKWIQRAEQVINKRIPNLSEDVIQAGKQVKNEIGIMSKELKPQLQKIKVGSRTKLKADTYKSIQSEILSKDTLNIAEKKAVKKAILKIKTAKNANDLWEARIEYDKSIPDRVRKANINSDNKLQLAQQTRKSTRNEINNMINEVSDWITDTNVRETFKDMSSLYEAGWNIKKRVGMETKGTEWIWKKIIGKAISKALPYALWWLGLEWIHKLWF